MRTLLILGLVLSAQLFIKGQNLVINPSFEELANIPENGLCYHFFKPKSIGEYCKGWREFSGDTPDLIVKDSTNELCQPVYPLDGRAMAGIYNFVPGADVNQDESYREFLMGSLQRPLEKGKVYEFSLWVQRNDVLGGQYLRQTAGTPIQTFGFASSHLGVIFTTDKPGEDENFLKDVQQFGEKPKVEFSQCMLTAVGEWIELKGSFTAWYPYRYFVIGNYAPDGRICISPEDAYHEVGEKNKAVPGTKSHPKQRRISYYCIDQVYVGPPRPSKLTTSLNKSKAFTFQHLVFESGSAKIQAGAAIELEELASYLQQFPDTKIMISGHTDDVGNPVDNLDLSEDRAAVVIDFLAKKGIAEERLNYQGLGESQPIADNKTAEGRAVNRRVEIKIIQ